MVYAVNLYQTLLGSSMLLSAGTISLLILSSTPPLLDPTIVLYVYALAPSLALTHHVISSLCSSPHIPSSQTRLLTTPSVAGTRKHISSTTNLLCLALLAIFVLSSGFVVLVQSVIEFAALDRIAKSATFAEASTSVSVAATTGLKDSLASNALVLQALLQITQGIVLGWMFGVAAQDARIVTAIERGLDPDGIMVQFDVEQGDSCPTLSCDEADEDEDK